MKNIIAILVISVLLVSCLYEKGGIIDPQNPTGGTTDPGSGGTSVTNPTNSSAICDLVNAGGSAAATNANGEICFDTQILPLIVSNCATSGCHDSKSRREGYELTSYATITKKGISPGKPSSSKIYAVLNANGEKRMPPLPKSRLSSAQIKLIADWISQGAKNITCATSSGSGGTLPDSVQMSYSNHIKPIMDYFCVSCHDASSASGGVRLDSYAAVNTQAKNGKLYGSVAQLSGYIAMPVGSRLSDCQIMAIKQWVDQGAKNN